MIQMHMDTRKGQNRDNDVHFRLRNWGLHQRSEMRAGPRENPRPSSWQDQITGRILAFDYDCNQPQHIDVDDAVFTHKALMLCSILEPDVYKILAGYYRDQEYKGVFIRKARNKFWKYL